MKIVHIVDNAEQILEVTLPALVNPSSYDISSMIIRDIQCAVYYAIWSKGI